jgi:hypothetical protein
MGTHCAGLHLPAKDRKYIVSAIPQNDERLDKLTLDPDGEFVLPGPCTLSSFGGWHDLIVISSVSGIFPLVHY